MPGFDKTGPAGQGPMTGRRMGQCVNTDPENQQSTQQNQTGYYKNPAAQERPLGRGLGRGRGLDLSLGLRNRFRGW